MRNSFAIAAYSIMKDRAIPGWSDVYMAHHSGESLAPYAKTLRKLKRIVAKYHTHDEPVISKETYEEFISVIDYDIVCGFHSGFPPCCVRHYVGKWIWAVKDTQCRYYATHWAAIDAKRKYVMDEHGNRQCNIEYIPCPTCLANETFVDTLECPTSCRLKNFLQEKYPERYDERED